MSQFLWDNDLQILQSCPEPTEILPTSDILLILSNLNRRHTTQKKPLVLIWALTLHLSQKAKYT